jgi:oligopeptide/dipeptide ABC transporter ATP-binding protein
MYLGKVFELAQTSEFFENPLHPYTKMLLSSVPVISKEEEALRPKRISSKGEVPSPVNTPSGCSFHPRCPSAIDVCSQVDPRIIKVTEDHTVKCQLFTE